LISEFGNCFLGHLIGKTAFAEPLSDFPFAAGPITEIVVGCIKTILQAATICQLARL
jgi:hypothetical protein